MAIIICIWYKWINVCINNILKFNLLFIVIYNQLYGMLTRWSENLNILYVANTQLRRRWWRRPRRRCRKRVPINCPTHSLRIRHIIQFKLCFKNPYKDIVLYAYTRRMRTKSFLNSKHRRLFATTCAV